MSTQGPGGRRTPYHPRGMRVTVNGDSVDLDRPIAVSTLLERLAPGAHPCAVEINRRLVPAREHRTQLVREGDTIEIVTLVGGG